MSQRDLRPWSESFGHEHSWLVLPYRACHAGDGVLARPGASWPTVVLNGPSRELLDAAHGALSAEGLITVKAQAFDASHREQVDEPVRVIEADHSPIEILVNNAGIQRRGAF